MQVSDHEIYISLSASNTRIMDYFFHNLILSYYIYENARNAVVKRGYSYMYIHIETSLFEATFLKNIIFLYLDALALYTIY